MSKKDKKKNENGSIFKYRITLITVIASLLAAIGTLLTLVFLINQHKTSIKPEIVINDSKFLFFCENYHLTHYVNFYITNSKFDTSVFFNYTSSNNFVIKPIKQRNSFYFSPKNIGRGVAKDIELTWRFDTTSLISVLLSNKREVLFDTAFLSKNSMLFITGSDTSLYLKRDMNNTDRINYILPVNTENERNEINIQIPDFYLNMFAKYVVLKQYISMKSHLKDELKGSFPDLFLKIKYKDISNNKDDVTYRIHFKNLGGSGGTNKNSVEINYKYIGNAKCTKVE